MCPFEFWNFFKNDLLPTLFASLTQKILACITPHQNMRPPLIYPQPPPISIIMVSPCWCAWLHSGIRVHRQVLKRSDFLKYHQNPQVLKRQSKEKKGRERKAPRVSSNKWQVNILRGEKHFNFKNPFWCDFIFPLPSYHFKNPFQNYWESFLNSFSTIL
jgi:hypothetical protein